MKKLFNTFVIITISLFLSLSFLNAEEGNVSDQSKYQRIVSFLPSVTEVLYALGLGDNVVGVTRYCFYPSEAQEKTKIGGVIDTSFETVLNLNPDLCIVATNSKDQIETLHKMELDVLEIETRSVQGILESIQKIGRTTGKGAQAQRIVERTNARIEVIRKKVEGKAKPRVLITFLRPMGEGVIKDVYIAGNFTYFDDLIKFAGGTNAYQGTAVITSPVVSPEGILEMNPDFILEIMSALDKQQLSKSEVLNDWDMLPELKAYKKNRIYIMDQQYIKIPGPRVDLALRDIARLIHPEIDWEEDE